MGEKTFQFQKNLDRWALMCPNGIKYVTHCICQSTKLCQSLSGDKNLIITKNNNTTYLHSQDNPLLEAENWFASLNLKKIQVLYVYKVGLGYCYSAAKKWLKEDENRTLVFFESDPEVLRLFFESDRAEKLLNDPQVVLYLINPQFHDLPPPQQLTIHLAPYPWILSSLTPNDLNFLELKKILDFYIPMQAGALQEGFDAGIVVSRNFYINYLSLANAYLGNHLFHQFRNVPAIICGAGPSLDKNIELLSTLNNKALIFAGGTALNALNGKNIMPHFGVGIDPNPAQFTRLIMNHAYETPFIFRSRMLPEALEMVHGDRLQISGTIGYGLGSWIEKNTGVENITVEEGFNVLNFSTVLAHMMGCNPIICVGIDLAYSKGASYASGIISHPIHDRRKDFHTRSQEDEVLNIADIYGQPVSTLTKWKAESMWYSHFPQKYQGSTLINATEGGIGFQGIPNMTLKDACQKYLIKTHDLKTRVYGETQNSRLPAEKTKELIISLIKSFDTCAEKYLKIITLQLEADKKPVDESEVQINKLKNEISSEAAYEAVLKSLDVLWPQLEGIEILHLNLSTGILSEQEILAKKQTLEIKRCKFLHQACLNHAMIIQQALEKTEKYTLASLETVDSPLLIPKTNEEDVYVYENHLLTLIDPEMDIHYSAEFIPDLYGEIGREYYSNGQLKYEQLYKKELLHGPSTFYQENGKILARSWFIDGQRQGKMWTYYANGNLQSLQRYKNNREEGVHLYYYSDGHLKSMLSYLKGQLHGDVALYHPNGKPSRQLYFIENMRFGKEKFWNIHGNLIIEAEYRDNSPIGKALRWHPNGILAKEIIYNDTSEQISCQDWDSNGKLIPQELVDRPDYFVQVHKQMNNLTYALGGISKEVFNVTTTVKTKEPLSFDSQFEEIQKTLNQLHQLEQQINKKDTTDIDKNNPKESLWKIPSLRSKMESQITQMHESMNKDLIELANAYNKILKKGNEKL